MVDHKQILQVDVLSRKHQRHYRKIPGSLCLEMFQVLIIQLLLIVLVFLYIYFTFRHAVVIPTAEENIEKISPGLVQLTANQDKITFWFYSLSERAYVKYTLDKDMKIERDNHAQPPSKVVELSSGYYYNVSRQRWERKYAIDVPKFVPKSEATNSLEQKFKVCDIEDNCEETRWQTFVQLRIGGEEYLWDGKKLRLPFDDKFPDAPKCKFTTNRYRQYLGMSTQPSPDNDVERDIGVYFVKRDGRWKLQECERPDMIFDGSICVPISQPDNDTTIERVNELFAPHITQSDLANKGGSINTQCIQLNSEHSTYVNLNVEHRVYVYEVDFYRSCDKTIFLAQEENVWQLKQIINNTTRENLKLHKRHLCPILDERLKVWNVDNGEIVTLEKPFVVFRNEIFHVHDYLLPLLDELQSMRTFKVLTKSDGNVKNVQLLPHLREFEKKNKHDTMCKVYAMFVGAIAFDIFIETRLLVDYIQVSDYDFYMRPTFPTIATDFQLDTWSCAHEVDTEMFTYISLVDMYEGLKQYAGNNMSV